MVIFIANIFLLATGIMLRVEVFPGVIIIAGGMLGLRIIHAGGFIIIEIVSM